MKDTKLFAEAWVVISSVAMGMGLEKCHFFKPDDMSFMWKPAKDAMTEDEILTLNRVVTANFRNSERKGRLLLDRLTNHETSRNWLERRSWQVAL